MKRFSRRRVTCAAAAILFTGMSFSVFVSAAPGQSGRQHPVVESAVPAKRVQGNVLEVVTVSATAIR